MGNPESSPLNLEEIREDLLRGPLRIAVFGEFSSGKSTFINALLGEELLTVATEPTTALPTEMTYGGAFNIYVLSGDGNTLAQLYGDGEIPYWARLVGRGLLEKLKSEAERIREFVRTWTAEGGRSSEGAKVRIVWPQQFLRQRLVLVDTPGTNVEIDRHGAMTKSVASEVDLAICLVDARHGLKATSLHFIQDIALRVGRIFVVLNKIDCIDCDEREDLIQELQAVLKASWPETAPHLGSVHSVSSLAPFDSELVGRNPELMSLISEFKSDLLTMIKVDRGSLILRRSGDPIRHLMSMAMEAEKSGDLHTEHESLREALELCTEAEISPSDALVQAMNSCEDRLGNTVNEEALAQDLLSDAIALMEAGKSSPSALANALERAAISLIRVNHRDEAVVEAFAKVLEAHPELRPVLSEPMRLVVPKAWVDSFTQDLEGLLGASISTGDPALEKKVRLGSALEIPSAWALRGAILVIQGDETPDDEVDLPSGGKRKTKLANEGLRWIQKAAANGDPISMWLLGRMYSLEEGPAPFDRKIAMEWYLRAADKGLVKAMVQIAECFESGIGVQQSHSEALRMYRKAADTGDPAGQNALAVFLDERSSGEFSAEAIVWYRRAAEQGLAVAQANLGQKLIVESSGNSDGSEGFKWLMKAAEQGYAIAENMIGCCFMDGLACAQNPEMAFAWIKKAAEQGHPEAEANLARCYEEGIGTEIDQEAWSNWLIRASNHGNAASQLRIGMDLVYAEGDDADIPEGIDLIRTAASNGYAEAMRIYADLLRFGKQIEADPSSAVDWYRKSAELGDPAAQLSLAELLDDGVGCQKNREEAFLWLRRSVDQGYAPAQHALGSCYRTGDGVPQDFAEATRLILLAANQGHSGAQNLLGLCYQHGEGVQQNTSDAVAWYRKAADAENILGQLNLAICFRDGVGVLQDLKEAAFWFRKAAEQGEDDAQNLLGECYKEGHGVPKSLNEAINWFRKAADQGNHAAQCNLGLCYAEGEGVTKSTREAITWFRLSAEQGNIAAQYFLGLVHAGEGRAGEAAKWYAKAAEEGLGAAQLALGWMHRNGEGVAQNYHEAFKMFSSAADQGELEAHIGLGLCYENGQGQPTNLKKAFEHYNLVASQGNSTAQYFLANCYMEGKGVAQNQQTAVRWFRSSAEGGDADAQYMLGLCYANGEGVPQNLDLAKQHLQSAANMGNADAVTALNQIQENESSCFITTASSHVLGWSDQGSELSLFRAFRDRVMKADKAGLEEINHYYQIAPKIVEFVNSLDTSREIWHEIAHKELVPIHERLLTGREDEARTLYRDMVNRLSGKYLN
jgi:TPR repeat protein/GTPase SAR1 family protein